MAKYRILSKEELQIFDEQLKHFLIVNGIEGDKWKEINDTNPDLAIDLVEVFSDQILQKAYENIEYLQKLTKDTCYFFHYGKEKGELIAIQQKDKTDASVDLSTMDNLKFILGNRPNDITFFHQEKEYTKEREMEIHEMITNGCRLFDKHFWEILQTVIY